VGTQLTSAHKQRVTGHWRIERLGGLRAVSGDRVVTRFRSRRAASLLAYLAYYRSRLHPREVLIDLFWPESEVAPGRQNLSQSLSSLRHQLEPPGVPPGSVLIADRHSVGFNPDAIRTDAAEFEAALRAAVDLVALDRIESLAAAIDLYKGPLLPGYYDDWIIPEQERLADPYFGAVHELACRVDEEGAVGRAIDYARRAVAPDPLREDAQRDLIRLLAAAGQPAAALRQYGELEELLRQEVGGSPSADTRRLAQQIEARMAASGGVSAPAPRHPPPAPHRATSPALPTGTVTFLLAGFERPAAPAEARDNPSGDTLGPTQESLRREFAATAAARYARAARVSWRPSVRPATRWLAPWPISAPSPAPSADRASRSTPATLRSTRVPIAGPRCAAPRASSLRRTAGRSSARRQLPAYSAASWRRT
jgi:DNA-binding SARP family transcriptional activator